jgi:molybdate transport system substrate-binding protein
MKKLPGAALLILAATAIQGQDAKLYVICSNGFRAVMEKVAHDKANFEFGASANLLSSIEGGTAFDVTVLSSPVIGELTKAGKIAAGTTMDLASSGIGVAVREGAPKPDVSNAAAIKKALLEAKSVGYVQVGAGTPAILDMLQRLGILKDLEPKTVFQAGAEASMKNVAAGKIDLALALVSEIVPAHGVQFAGAIPAEFQKKITMTAGISSATKNRAAAEQFIKSFTSASAVAAIRAAGMEPSVSH